MSKIKFSNSNRQYNHLNKNATLEEVFSNISSGITGFFVFIILTLFPIYTHDMYFDILGARYAFFKIWSILLVAILVCVGLIYCFIDYNNHLNEPTAIIRFFNCFKIKNIKKHIIITDVFFVSMIIVCIISTLNSDFKEEAFYGNSGRYQGLECWLLYFITYFAITRTFKFKKIYLDFALIAGCFACLWGNMDFFWLDPFGFFKNVSYQQHTMFASSIGNLNTYTNYTILIFSLAGVMFLIEKNRIRTIIYLLASLLSCSGCIFGLADNAVLGLFAFYLFIPFFIIKTRRDLIRYFILIDVLLICVFAMWVGLKYPHNSGQGSFFIDAVKSKAITFAFIPFTFVTILLFVVMYKMKPSYSEIPQNNLTPLDSLLPKQIKLGYIILVIVGFLLVTYILLDVNVFHKHLEIWNKIPSSHQLKFDDNWGTHRGHNWRIAFTNFFQNFDIMKKLFGYGPDTYLIVSERTFYEEMVNRYGEVYDSAHNEYINYLICEGILGLISYLGIFISGIVYAVKSMKKNVLIFAATLAVITYMVQAIVNIAIPITTPVFFSLMYMGVAHYLEYKKEKETIDINNVKC